MIQLLPVAGLPEVAPGDDLAALLAGAMPAPQRGDVLVVAQKVVSKAEGRLVDPAAVQPSTQARELVERLLPGTDPRHVQVMLDESVRVVRADRVLITETRHGFVCANAGVDHSNVPGGLLCLLPLDPDASAEALRRRLRDLTGVDLAVIVSDTFGRPWRMGIVNVALGVAGLPALADYRGRADDHGRVMTGTTIAIADELAAAAELAMGKTGRVPAVVVRGYRAEGDPGRGGDLVMPAALDLFR